MYMADGDVTRDPLATPQQIGIQKAEQRAVERLANSKTSAIYEVTANMRCNNCPSNKCPGCPMFGIGESAKNDILGPVIEASLVSAEAPDAGRASDAGWPPEAGLERRRVSLLSCGRVSRSPCRKTYVILVVKKTQMRSTGKTAVKRRRRKKEPANESPQQGSGSPSPSKLAIETTEK